MDIILKFTLRNIKEKKLRTFLIILSVMLSAALYFGSTGLSKTIEKTYTQYLTKYYGTAEIMIYPNQNSPSAFIPDYQLNSFADELEYAVGVMHGSGVYKVSRDEVLRFNILGYELDELSTMHTLVLSEQAGIEPFSGRKVIISRDTAQKYGLEIGENLALDVHGQRIHFKIVGIAQPTGLFLEDGRNTYAVVPKEYINSLNQVRGKSNTIYIKLLDGSQKNSFIERLAQEYPRYTVTETIREADIKEYTNQITQPFIMMVAIVILISIFIIYTSFKVIAYERIPVIGTFRSVGATRKMVNTVFLVESIVYGIIGGITGSFLGIGVLHVMAKLTTPSWLQGITTHVVYTPAQVLTTFALAVVLSFSSAFIPIWKVAKIPVKDIVLNNIENKKKPRKYKYMLGLIFVGLSMLIPPLLPYNLVMPLSTVSMLLGITGIIMLLPLIINTLIKVMEGLFAGLFGNEGLLALKNLRNNKNIINNIALLYIGITCILIVKIVGVSVMTEVTSFFRNWKFEILAAPQMADRHTEAGLRSVAGVEDTYGALMTRNVEVVGTDYIVWTLEGINERFFDFMNIEVPGGPGEAVKKLNSGRYIIVSTHIKKLLGLKENDIMTLKTPRGDVPYQIIGFTSTIENNGNYVIMSDRYLRLDMNEQYYNMVYIKTNNDPKLVQQKINRKYSRTPFWNDTVENIVQRNYQMNSQLFLLLDGFSYVTIVIGIFGVLNNYIISFMERRRSFAVLRSIGMSIKQTQKMLFIEALSGGLIAGIIGVIGGIMGINTISYLLRSMGLSGTMQYDFTVFWLAVIAGVGVSVVASISPALKTSKMSIVSSLKYE
ncbi:ABC transporter permease [Desulfitibacter alkalitolerans]|uniref:ABC transporter permease n=1 Tax=Desulfitibacter alkalitolerans TaxID=264641 RepID=UPI00048207CB|nr:ABC transporter permease [Desulfitibacter alkalitolerans]